ncbi:MAG: hypothetical protein IJ737_07850 [Ruminococcus sp.]|nr:hypothetical protein [Ruminococcus sp.]
MDENERIPGTSDTLQPIADDGTKIYRPIGERFSVGEYLDSLTEDKGKDEGRS